jgi:UDP-N-acetylmuramoylalanine--D-glutamate ligase
VAESLHGKRVTLVGLGTRQGGLGIARYLVEQGAQVTVTDLRSEEDLAETISALQGLPIHFVLGQHEERDFTPEGADLVVRNPAVPRRAPLLQLARQHGVPIEMEMSLFFRACSAPIVGVTGTKGKTTVSTLAGALLREAIPGTRVGGNMGVTALGQLDDLAPDAPIVLELSSWQLEALIEHKLAPHVAVLTLIAEDHLNTYDGFEDYAATKRGIAWHQQAGDYLVVNRDDPESWRAAIETAASVVPFGLTDAGEDGAWQSGGELVWRWRGVESRWSLPQSPALRGPHGRRNALAAIAAAMLAGSNVQAIQQGLDGFAGVKDRMEVVGTIEGVTYINDTTATAPVAAAAALGALADGSGQIHLLAGGADKKLDPAPLARAAAESGALVYLFNGTATPALHAALTAQSVEPKGFFDYMRDAVETATTMAGRGDTVLLSPGCASFGLFRDEFDRGEQFRQVVRALAAAQVEATRD